MCISVSKNVSHSPIFRKNYNQILEIILGEDVLKVQQNLSILFCLTGTFRCKLKKNMKLADNGEMDEFFVIIFNVIIAYLLVYVERSSTLARADCLFLASKLGDRSTEVIM